MFHKTKLLVVLSIFDVMFCGCSKVIISLSESSNYSRPGSPTWVSANMSIVAGPQRCGSAIVWVHNCVAPMGENGKNSLCDSYYCFNLLLILFSVNERHFQLINNISS